MEPFIQVHCPPLYFQRSFSKRLEQLGPVESQPKHPKVSGSIEPGTRSPASAWQVAGRGHVLGAIDTRHVPATGVQRPCFRSNVEFPQIVQEGQGTILASE